jgi:hypothetical protein
MVKSPIRPHHEGYGGEPRLAETIPSGRPRSRSLFDQSLQPICLKKFFRHFHRKLYAQKSESAPRTGKILLPGQGWLPPKAEYKPNLIFSLTSGRGQVARQNGGSLGWKSSIWVENGAGYFIRIFSRRLCDCPVIKFPASLYFRKCPKLGGTITFNLGNQAVLPF